MAKLWLADDNAPYLELLSEALAPMGHELTLLRDGTAVLKRLQDPKVAIPDLILTDVMMPGCDGFTLLQKLREDSRLRRVPVIVLTAKSSLRESFVLEPGVAAFLEKPVKFGILRAAVTRALKEQGAL